MENLKDDSENRKDSDGGIWNYLPTLLLSIVFIGFGLYLTIHDLIVIGIHSRTLQFMANGGELYILIGLIFLFVTYYSLSPFSWFRQFIEGRSKTKK